MTEPQILFDLTEFLHDGQRSGIQRVCYEIVAHWPESSRLVPACIDGRSRLVALSPDVLDLYRLFFEAPKNELPALRERMQETARHGTEIVSARRFRRFRGLLNATVFSLPHQVEYYLWAARHGLGEHIFLFIHDMLPWLQPELFTPGFGLNLANYLKCLRALPHLSFNSAQTRTDTLMRILRDGRKSGPVFPLGSDCLGAAEPHFDPARRQFAVVGTLEPRKNHRAVLEAFEQLWAEGVDVELAFAGKLGWLHDEDQQRIRRLKATQPRFRWWDNLGDRQIRDVIRGSRASIYPALFEGYGLPPVESLALGVPVIVTETIPSIAMLSSEGQVRLREPRSELIRQAVLSLLDDGFARRTTEEIRRLPLPLWSKMACGVECWIADRQALFAGASGPAAPLARAG